MINENNLLMGVRLDEINDALKHKRNVLHQFLYEFLLDLKHISSDLSIVFDETKKLPKEMFLNMCVTDLNGHIEKLEKVLEEL